MSMPYRISQHLERRGSSKPYSFVIVPPDDVPQASPRMQVLSEISASLRTWTLLSRLNALVAAQVAAAPDLPLAHRQAQYAARMAHHRYF